MPNIGIWEILLLLLVVLLVFGPKKLPEMGRSLGRGMREFKDSISGMAIDSKELDASEASAALPPGAPSSSPATTPSHSEPTSNSIEPARESAATARGDGSPPSESPTGDSGTPQ